MKLVSVNDISYFEQYQHNISKLDIAVYYYI